ncbi:MAG: SAM-dependent methyltransferase [Sutterellaceae bacterium]|nr:SAM-dependent methyltransferase [Burkholderiaceae bacterium]MCX7900947.1 SAM-dependent methyltransferase [Burkholderiaceae bacterium]MDW8429828.1 SAM-dependent methyltransferase [Sutterellaceae bacterium]
MTGARGRLLLLPTPLGPTPAQDVLPAPVVAAARATRHFLAERAKSARAFLRAIAHPLPLRALTITEIGHRPDVARIDAWLRPALDGEDVAIVVEAGCPGVADPGASIVARAHALDIPVKPLVGPSAILLTLMASGFNGQQFRFVGYLPQDARALVQAIAALESRARGGETQVWIETPYRNEKLFGTLLAHCAADTELCIAVSLTTAQEFIARRPIAQWRDAPLPAGLLRHPTVFALAAAPLSRRRAQ